MEWIRRTLRLPIHESHLGLALVFCVLMMSVMSIALIWQAEVIASQREAIRLLGHLKLGG